MSAKHKASTSSKQSTSKSTHTVYGDDKKMDHLLNFYVCLSLLSKERKKFNCFERFLWCELARANLVSSLLLFSCYASRHSPFFPVTIFCRISIRSLIIASRRFCSCRQSSGTFVQLAKRAVYMSCAIDVSKRTVFILPPTSLSI